MAKRRGVSYMKRVEEVNRIYDREGFSFSLVANTDKVEGLTIKGAKYEVEDCLLTNAFPLGISNVVKGFDGQD